jgi:hypothetical protein
MILREIAVEQFRFTCGSCDQSWTVDYDVQHVEDGHGHEHDYFFRNSLPSVDPTATESIICPHCRTTHVHARLIARRVMPAVSVVPPAEPPTRPSARLMAEREQASPLRGDEPTP